MYYHNYNQKVFFTSDQHFGHSNLIFHHRIRDFPTTEAMNNFMVNNWNTKVGKDDVVYHLGDFSLLVGAAVYFSLLNGKIRILKIPWHHDRYWLENPPTHSRFHLITYLDSMEMLKIDTGNRIHETIILSHFPLISWHASSHGSILLHGHSHGMLESEPENSYDVGVDRNYFTPVSLRFILEKFERI